MSTRCNIHFTYSNGETAANIYRHSDGYPEGVLPDLEQFFKDVQAQTADTRFGDPSYLAAKFVVWQAGQMTRYDLNYDEAKPRPLAFLGVGVMTQDAGDAEFVYTIACSGDGVPEVTYRKA